HGEIHRGTEYVVDFVPKLKVEMLVEESQVAEVTGAIRRAACTGRIGDGKIFVVDIDDAVRIRTGERGATAV
ncbi:P-II family nitrogen regulator, partial [bacterium]|nr:P-II family nitrogen regulator [bacterium]